MDSFSECFMSCDRNKKNDDYMYLLIYLYVVLIFMYLPKHVGEMENLVLDVTAVEMRMTARTAGGAGLYILLTCGEG